MVHNLVIPKKAHVMGQLVHSLDAVRQAGWLKLMKCAAWFCVAVLAYLSLIPSDLEIRTGLPSRLEHAFAYWFAGVAFGLAYREQHVAQSAGLVAYGCFLEGLQGLSPGRTPSALDAAASGLGALVGIAVAASLARVVLPTGWKR